MLGWIGFNAYRINCIIGTEAYEREEPQDLLIDLKVEVDFANVSLSGRLEDTIDYRSLSNLCKEMAVEGQYLLIEKYAADVVKKLLATFPVQSVWIRVKKPKGILHAEYALVELEYKR